jgi:Big-like domain-containing protein/VCBS repeat protein
VFRQNAAGTLDAPAVYESDEIPSAVEVGDLNGDGRADVAVGHDGWERVGVYLQRTDGTLGPETLTTVPYGNYASEAITIGDVTSDGRPDIVVAPHQTRLNVLRQLGPGPAVGELAFIRDHAPADFSLNIATTVNATVKFARAMDPATFSSATVVLLNGKTGVSVGITRSYNATTHVLTLDPTATLLKDTPYIVSVNTGVKDVNGVAMSSLYRYRFKTAA